MAHKRNGNPGTCGSPRSLQCTSRTLRAMKLRVAPRSARWRGVAALLDNSVRCVVIVANVRQVGAPASVIHGLGTEELDACRGGTPGWWSSAWWGCSWWGSAWWGGRVEGFVEEHEQLAAGRHGPGASSDSRRASDRKSWRGRDTRTAIHVATSGTLVTGFDRAGNCLAQKPNSLVATRGHWTPATAPTDHGKKHRRAMARRSPDAPFGNVLVRERDEFSDSGAESAHSSVSFRGAGLRRHGRAWSATSARASKQLTAC